MLGETKEKNQLLSFKLAHLIKGRAREAHRVGGVTSILEQKQTKPAVKQESKERRESPPVRITRRPKQEVRM